MRVIKAAIVLLAGAVLTTCAAVGEDTVAEPPNPLEVWWEMREGPFIMCEEFTIYLSVVNRSDETVLVPWAGDSQRPSLQLEIVTTEGRALPYAGLTHALHYDDVSLVPGDTMMFTIEVLAQFGQIGDRDQWPGCIPPAVYRANAVYLDKYSLPELRFEVLPPTPEQLELIDVMNRTWAPPRNTDVILKIDYLARIYSNNRESFLAPKMANILILDVGALDEPYQTQQRNLHRTVLEDIALNPVCLDVLRDIVALLYRTWPDDTVALLRAERDKVSLSDRRIWRFHIKRVAVIRKEMSLYERIMN